MNIKIYTVTGQIPNANSIKQSHAAAIDWYKIFQPARRNLPFELLLNKKLSQGEYQLTINFCCFRPWSTMQSKASS